jgi:hypothetical protein
MVVSVPICAGVFGFFIACYGCRIDGTSEQASHSSASDNDTAVADPDAEEEAVYGRA